MSVAPDAVLVKHSALLCSLSARAKNFTVLPMPPRSSPPHPLLASDRQKLRQKSADAHEQSSAQPPAPVAEDPGGAPGKEKCVRVPTPVKAYLCAAYALPFALCYSCDYLLTASCSSAFAAGSASRLSSCISLAASGTQYIHPRFVQWVQAGAPRVLLQGWVAVTSALAAECMGSSERANSCLLAFVTLCLSFFAAAAALHQPRDNRPARTVAAVLLPAGNIMIAMFYFIPGYRDSAVACSILLVAFFVWFAF